ncbi:MAG: tetratricopeptide repeat protein, partial [Myxococcales bacterium]|nr:tetratricopeptide repeat protein [Myxococcales bacterium]
LPDALPISRTVSVLERACESTDDPEARAQILACLLDSGVAASGGAAAAPPGDPAEAALSGRAAEGAPSGDRPRGAPRTAPDPEARRKWFERLCELQRERGALDDAMATAVRAAGELPRVEALWDLAEGLARTLSRPEEMAALYESVLSRPLDRDDTLRLGERAVQFYEEWFEDSGRVVRILERVLELDPTADWAFDRLKLLLDAAERWDDLFALYDRALASASDAQRAALLEDAAQTAKDFADRPDKAIDYLERLNELRPDDPKLVSALERLYERQGRHAKLVALLGARLPALRPEEARRTRARMAALWLDELRQAPAALEVLEPVLDPEEPEGAAAPDLWALVERILAITPPSVAARPSLLPKARESERPARSKRRRSEAPPAPAISVRQRAAGWLREHYVHARKDADLIRMLVIELEAVQAPEERVRRHLQIAELFERIGDPTSAMEQVGLAFLLDPGDETKRERLLSLAERTGRLERLAELLVAGASAGADEALAIALTLQAAALRSDRIADPEGAIRLLGSVLAAPRLAADDLLAAGRRLEPLLEAAGRLEEQLDVAGRVAAVEPDPVAQREALGRAARLSTRLGQPARAVGLWEKRVAADPEDLEALDGLAGLLDGAPAADRARSERLAQILELRARVAPTEEARRADRVRVAALLGGVLGRPADAIQAWRDIERDFGEADDAALALADLLRATGRWKELAALLERSAERASDGAGRSGRLHELGDVLREHLDARAAAVETYGRALAADARNAGARAGLLALAGDDALRGAAVAVLLSALRACDDWRAVLDLTPHRLLAAETDEARLAVLIETAQIAEGRAGDAPGAFDAMRRALLLSPGDEYVDQEATRLAEAAGAWQGLVSAYEAAIEGPARADRPLATRLRTKAAATRETRLDDATGALADYLLVVAEVSDVAAGCAAVRVAGKLGDWQAAAKVVVQIAVARGHASKELLDAYDRAAAAAGGWDEATRALAEATTAAGVAGIAARDLEARIAVWHRDRRSDPGAAQAALERALAHDSSEAALLAMLVELQRRHRNRPLVENLVRLSQKTGGDPALLREAAEVAESALEDAPLTRSLLTDLLALSRARWNDETNVDAAGYARWAIESLAASYESGGEPQAVVEVLVQGDGLPFERDVRRGMRRRAARIALDVLSDKERAVTLYLALFDDDAHDAEAAERLAATYESQGRTRDLLGLRARQIAAARDVAERIALRLEAARLLVLLHDPAAAAERLRTNLDEEPRHEGTVEALAAVLRSGGDAPALHALLVDQARRAEADADPRRAADLFGRAALVAEDALHDAAVAEAHHARVAALEPRAASLDALGRLTTARGDHAAAASWLERLVQETAGDARVQATLRLADSLVAAGQPEAAADRLARAVRETPEAAPLRERLAALYRQKQDWERLAALTADAAAHAPDKPTRLARLLEAASLLSERCARADMAVPLLEQASDLAPDDQPVRLALADALARADRFEDARSILKSLVDAFGGRRPKERAAVHYQIARLELAMGNRARALVELDAAARVDPQNPDILRALAELARSDGQLDRAEKSYRALLVVLRRREESAPPPGVSRSEVLLELSSIAAEQGALERSREILESALEAAARGGFEQDRLEGALRARGDHETLARVLEGRLAQLGDSPEAAKPLADLAEVLASRLGRPDQALPVLIRAVSADPRSEAAHEAALALARSTGAAARYVEGVTALVDRAIERGEVALACALLERLGTVAERDLAALPRAAALLERAVGLGHRTPEVLRALDRVFGELGETAKQAGILELRASVEASAGDPRAASDPIYRLAALRLSTPATVDEGIALMGRALDLEPDLDRAEEALRRAVALHPSNVRVLDLYERVGRAPGRERALVAALRARFELPGADPAVAREAVQVAMRAGGRDLARSLLNRVIERAARTPAAAAEPDPPFAGTEDADVAWAYEALSDLDRAAGDLPKAVELRRGAAKVAADPEVARRVTFEAARIAADELGDAALAAELFEGLHASDPVDRSAWEPLAAAYRKLGESEKLARLLATVVDTLDDPQSRARLRLERLRAMQGVGLSDAEAAPLLREIVDEDAGQVEAALMLSGILERASAHDEL